MMGLKTSMALNRTKAMGKIMASFLPGSGVQCYAFEKKLAKHLTQI
jgi:hypothetical protein